MKVKKGFVVPVCVYLRVYLCEAASGHQGAAVPSQPWAEPDRREQPACSAILLRCSEAVLALCLIVMTTCASAVFSALFSERREPTWA